MEIKKRGVRQPDSDGFADSRIRRQIAVAEIFGFSNGYAFRVAVCITGSFAVGDSASFFYAAGRADQKRKFYGLRQRRLAIVRN